MSSSGARSLPPSLAPVVAALEFEPPEGPLSLADIARLANLSPERARLTASRLAKHGWLERIRPGLYEFVPAAQGFPFGTEWHALVGVTQEVVVSGLTAARLHGLTPQLPSRHLLVMRVDRAVPRPIARSERFRVARLKPWRVFGAERQTIDGVSVPIARPERVLLDAIERPDWFAGVGETARILARGLPRADRDRLVAWAERWRSRALLRRVGWWGERVLGPGAWSAPQRERLTAGAPHGNHVGALVHGVPPSGRRDPRWGVVVNVPEDALKLEDAVR